jgi:hypothetical protein
MIHFEEGKHDITGTKVVEVWIDSKMVATIYPNEPNSIRVLSAHQRGTALQYKAAPGVDTTEVYFTP